MAVNRRTVNPSGYPNLVVIYLGMRVNAMAGLKTVLGFGPKISEAVGKTPDGLLLHENLIMSVFPFHVGMRQYWRDFESLETWSRSDPHRAWWKQFLRDSGGVGFWHETYFMRGGIEAIYDDVPGPLGLMAFAPTEQASGPMFSSRQRLKLAGEASLSAPLVESDLDEGKR